MSFKNENGDKPTMPEPTRCVSRMDDAALLAASFQIAMQRRAARRTATPQKEPVDTFEEIDVDEFDELPDIDGALMEEIIEAEIRIWNQNRGKA